MTQKKNWPRVKELIESLTAEDLEAAAKSLGDYGLITDPKIRALQQILTATTIDSSTI